MADIISNVSSIFTAAIGWVGQVAETVTSTPILLVFAIIPLVGIGVSLFRRLLSVQ